MSIIVKGVSTCYLDKPINTERLSELFEYNCTHRAYDMFTYAPIDGCDEYIAHCFYFSNENKNKFGVTPILMEKWEYYWIDFCVYVHIIDGHVKSCSVLKYRDGNELKPTAQESRIFKRIMDYITS